MAARIQVLPVLPSCSSLSISLPSQARSHRWSICRLFSDKSLYCRRTPPSPSGLFARRSSFEENNFASAADLSADTPLKVVLYPDPRLRAKNKRINTFDENLKNLADEMFDVMYKTDGIGLSAPQVGLNIQLMVFNPAGERGEGEEIVLVNPVVHKASKKTLLFNEGCLSFPGIYADVLRPASVKVDARDVSGARFRINLSGLPARIFQHEYDHLMELDLEALYDEEINPSLLMGSLFFDRMTEDVIDGIRSQLKALEKKYEDLTGQASPEKIDNHKPKQQIAHSFTI